MSGKQGSVAQDLEQLFRKTIEANQQFISAGARLVKDLGSSNRNGEDLVSAQKEFLTDAFSQFVKLNIQYASNLVDLGVSLSQKMGQQGGGEAAPAGTAGGSSGSDGVVAGSARANDAAQAGDEKPQAAAQAAGEPAFVLKGSGAPGSTVTMPFLLDSDKKEPVFCRLVQSAYQRDDGGEAAFETEFTPQSFQLQPGAAQKVNIEVRVPVDATTGVYHCQVRVEGYEKVFFSLYVQVI
jgi:hypothetical protein